ncbi:transmembrane protein 218 isoform X1 [Takifugu flavidus]|uniref:transmembrane protein 218 isoform X1 n=1 Tax=Takifugu flavidus TaxID=433684 RepID=UPI0005D2A61B|nr:transmembrane protein 218 isoform X1 [Takifugu flavidus]|eukprot:XP_011609339.1 PREDICTED: transmembrane protein 218 isoform X1 [Takifugu rubripes]
MSALQVGTGVIVIAVIWIATLVLGILFLRASGSTNRFGVIPVFFLALTVTLVLVFFPRSSETSPPFKEVEIVDTLFIGRYVLLALVSVVFLVAFFMLLPFHFLEPVYAKTLRSQ